MVKGTLNVTAPAIAPLIVAPVRNMVSLVVRNANRSHLFVKTLMMCKFWDFHLSNYLNDI